MPRSSRHPSERPGRTRSPKGSCSQPRAECLDWVLIRSERHAERVLRELVAHYDHQRPHRGIDLEPPVPTWRCRSSKVGALSSELTVSAGCCTNTRLLRGSRLAMSLFGKYVEFPLSRLQQAELACPDDVVNPLGKHLHEL